MSFNENQLRSALRSVLPIAGRKIGAEDLRHAIRIFRGPFTSDAIGLHHLAGGSPVNHASGGAPIHKQAHGQVNYEVSP